MWDCWLYGREWVGSGDGTWDPQLWEDVTCLYGLALKA